MKTYHATTMLVLLDKLTGRHAEDHWLSLLRAARYLKTRYRAGVGPGAGARWYIRDHDGLQAWAAAVRMGADPTKAALAARRAS